MLKINLTDDILEEEANISALSRGSNPESTEGRSGPPDPLVRPGNKIPITGHRPTLSSPNFQVEVTERQW